MIPGESADQGLNCYKCGKLVRNIHLCKAQGFSQIICDDCCKKLLQEKQCQHRECGHYRGL